MADRIEPSARFRLPIPSPDQSGASWGIAGEFEQQQIKKPYHQRRSIGPKSEFTISAFRYVYTQRFRKTGQFGTLFPQYLHSALWADTDSAALFLEGDCVRPRPELTELIEPDRIAFVAPLILRKIGFNPRGSNCYTTQSADRIVCAIRV
jgi:hypothetical protein